MQNIIKRDEYLYRIIDRKENGLIKVITGIRRCGKSFLLFNLFYDYLIESGVKEEQIITIALDDDTFVKYRDPDELSKYIRGKIVNSICTIFSLMRCSTQSQRMNLKILRTLGFTMYLTVLCGFAMLTFM